jgi:hypothetical protein
MREFIFMSGAMMTVIMALIMMFIVIVRARAQRTSGVSRFAHSRRSLSGLDGQHAEFHFFAHRVPY